MVTSNLHPDAKVRQILNFLSPHIQQHQQDQSVDRVRSKRPLIVGVSGLQGSGKSYLSSELVTALTALPYNINAAEISLDDFYVTRNAQESFAFHYPGNSLLVKRGQPGTHDLQLVKAFFDQFEEERERELFWPSFDKSLFNGKGDRAPRSEWKVKNTAEPPDVLIFEGWCVGFQPLGETEVRRRWESAQGTQQVLSTCRLQDAILLDQFLKQYCDTFMGQRHLDVLVQLQAKTLQTVYEWRGQQEAALRANKGGSGMTSDEVQDFVRGYFPAYELYLDNLSNGFFDSHQEKSPKEIHLLIDTDRSLIEIVQK